MKALNDKIEKEEDKPLSYATVECTPSGFYKITFDDVKWYDSYSDVQNFELGLDKMREQNVPFSFVRLGEDPEDIEHTSCWPEDEDMPDEIETFEPVVDVNDENFGEYTPVSLDEPSKEEETSMEKKVKPIMMEFFDKYEEADDIKDELRSLHSDGAITDNEYDYAITKWDEWLKEWEADR